MMWIVSGARYARPTRRLAELMEEHPLRFILIHSIGEILVRFFNRQLLPPISMLTSTQTAAAIRLACETEPSWQQPLSRSVGRSVGQEA